MTAATPNPFCRCDPCLCEPPCTCGLAPVSRSSEEKWSDGTLHHTVVVKYQPVPEAPNSGPAGDHHVVEEPEIGEPEDALAPSLDAATRRQSVLQGYERTKHGPAHSGHDGHSSVRRAVHKGHEVEVRTTYEVSIDGQTMDAHFGVSNDGTVHYHGLPNYSTASAIDLLKDLVDAFPDDYPPLDDGGAG